MRSPQEYEDFKERLKTDVVLFADFFFDIELDPKQIDFAISCLENKHTVAIFSRQTGKTTTIIILIAFILVNHRQVMIQCYAPTEKQALGVIFDRLREMLEGSPLLYNKIAKDGMRKSGSILMKNGNRFQIQTANRDSNIRGFSPTHIILDESQDIPSQKYNADIVGSGAAMKGLTATERRRIRKLPEKDRQAAMDEVTIKTKIWECGTPKGRSHFYEITLPGTKAHIVYQKWFESSFIDKEYVLQKKRELPEATFKAEFECEFDLTEGFAFDRADIMTASEGNSDRKFYRNPAAIYVCGIDLGRTQDHSVMVVLEVIGPIRKMVFMERWELGLKWEHITEEMKMHLIEWNPDQTFVDCTGPTGDVFDFFFADWEVIETEGMEITKKSKPQMMGILKIQFQRELIEIWDDDILMQELWICPEDTSGDQARFPGPEKGHDDTVQALMLAVYAAHEYLGVSYEEEEEVSKLRSKEYGHRQVTQNARHNREPVKQPVRAQAEVDPTGFNSGESHAGISATELPPDMDSAFIGRRPTMWDSKDGWTKIAGKMYREL